jgi:putative sterol carrier protein
MDLGITQLADGFARVVGDVPPDRLERLMRTPLRRPLLDAIFWQMPKHLDRSRAARLSANVRWRITESRSGDADVYDLAIMEGRCHVSRGEGSEPPQVTITVDRVEFLQLITGNSDALQAYFRGRLALAGDIMLAAKLISLFRIPNGGSSRRP